MGASDFVLSFAASLRSRGICSASTSAVLCLHRLTYGRATISEMAKAAAISVPAASKQVDVLRRSGLVERHARAFLDRRCRYWQLSDQGNNLIYGNQKDGDQKDGEGIGAGAGEVG